MTDSQVKYQTLMENRRHNMEVERYNATQAQAAKIQADIAKAKWGYEEPWAADKALFEKDLVYSQIWKNSAGGWGDILKGVSSFGKILFA